MLEPNPEEFEAFLQVIKDIESYGGDYTAEGKPTGDSRGVARGAYQIMSGYWPEFAEDAGLERDADPWNPQNQERVARHRFRYLYNKYGGSWEAAAIAWHAGEGSLKKYLSLETQAERDRFLANKVDNLGGSTGEYVVKLREGLEKYLPQRLAGPVEERLPEVDRVGMQQVEEQRRWSSRRQTVQDVLNIMSEFVRANAEDPEVQAEVERAMSPVMMGIAGRAGREPVPVPRDTGQPPTEAGGTGMRGVR